MSVNWGCETFRYQFFNPLYLTVYSANAPELLSRKNNIFSTAYKISVTKNKLSQLVINIIMINSTLLASKLQQKQT